MSALDSLAASTVVVVDTADLDLLSRWSARDATTNPSLIRRAAADPRYEGLVASAVRGSAKAHDRLDALLVAFGLEILQRLPGRVSTEVDARLSFDTEATLQRARALMARYAAAGVPRDRVLIKIAATWEGIQAARQLEAEGIHCNLTLLFSFTQAKACAVAGVKLISPFVGRITDWHRQQAGAAWNADAHRGAADPGVQAVVRIWRHYKQHGVATEVMGASFRDLDQIAALAGCDLLTIPPTLLDALAASDRAMPRQLDAASLGPATDAPPPALSQADFAEGMRQDRMASEKLHEGVRLFSADTEAVLSQLAAA
ncbi:transaldolase [Thiomonas bhubaneswarensis]|uniref:transaldolase n=1 Tax=Thiomonas bhubaneswarensis TaxID=339866 RepID=A0A0K6HSJ7_9BURK|nr:transaldolase [Thiomonas bhubaneswarensis]CUA93895.1 Transaldolase [Thiomonas bhubaneswarensis]